jgi:two-component system response regulator AlgR
MDVLVVDDEKLARDRLVRMVEKIDDCNVVGEAADGRSALKEIEAASPDVVLLDIRMPDMDGMEAARHISQLDEPPAVIFCTAYGEHALEAFDAHAVGYLLKPVKQEQLEDSLASARKLTKVQLSTLNKDGRAKEEDPEGRKHISSKTRLGLELVPIEDVRCFQADHKYVTAYHTNGEILIDDTLKDLEDEFGSKFVRIHRNSLVSLDHIEGMDKVPPGQYAVRLQGIEHKPVVSRRHVTELRKTLRNL